MPVFILIITLLLGLAPSNSWAVPTVETAQNEVDRLRTLAAEKFEAANEATIRIRELEKQTAVLEDISANQKRGQYDDFTKTELNATRNASVMSSI